MVLHKILVERVCLGSQIHRLQKAHHYLMYTCNIDYLLSETKVREPEVIVKSLSTSWNHNTLNDQLVEDTVTDKLVLKNISFEVTKVSKHFASK